MNIALAVNVKERLISAVKGLRGLMGSQCGAMEGHGQESSLMRPSRDFSVRERLRRRLIP
jgi:hypothetical protein